MNLCLTGDHNDFQQEKGHAKGLTSCDPYLYLGLLCVPSRDKKHVSEKKKKEEGDTRGKAY